MSVDAERPASSGSGCLDSSAVKDSLNFEVGAKINRSFHKMLLSEYLITAAEKKMSGFRETALDLES